MMSNKIRYYNSFTDDLIESRNQEFKIPDNYKWVRTDFLSRFLSGAVYSLAFILSSVYCRVFLHTRFKNSRVLRKNAKNGAFIYANHTQPVGDVFAPALAAFPHRIYTLVSPSNYGIPFIGKILPYLGALPVIGTLKGMKNLSAAIEYRLKQNKCIVVYPEAHVWEYYTGIRPFPDTSFKYPVKHGVPVFCMTSTYQKRRFGKKPALVIYIDGPFYPDTTLSVKQQTTLLHDTVYNTMKKRSENSNCQYIRYEQERNI